jgi:hypothetical protein
MSINHKLYMYAYVLISYINAAVDTRTLYPNCPLLSMYKLNTVLPEETYNISIEDLQAAWHDARILLHTTYHYICNYSEIYRKYSAYTGFVAPPRPSSLWQPKTKAASGIYERKRMNVRSKTFRFQILNCV